MTTSVESVAGIEPDWDKVHALLEQWAEVWKADKAKFAEQYPQWIQDAAAELFAHDLCDQWAWHDYVKAASVIISRHATSERSRVIAELAEKAEVLSRFRDVTTEKTKWLEVAAWLRSQEGK